MLFRPQISTQFKRVHQLTIPCTRSEVHTRCDEALSGVCLQFPDGLHVESNNSFSVTELEVEIADAQNLQQQGLHLSRDLIYSVLQNSIKNKRLDVARCAHTLMVSTGPDHASVLDDRLIHLFVLCGSLLEASLVFCCVAKPSCHTWQAIISAYASLDYNHEALHLFCQMQHVGTKVSKVTFLCVLKVCRILAYLSWTFLIHGLIINSQIESDTVVMNALIDTYAKCGSFMDASCSFRKMSIKDVVSWNAIIAGYASHGQDLLALECLHKMLEEKVEPNHLTFSSILKACGTLETLEQGRLLHRELLKMEVPLDLTARNTLIDMYARCGNLEDAYSIFNSFSDRDVVSWGALMAGCAQHGHEILALELFVSMQQAGVNPDNAIYVSILQSCGSLGALGQGMLLHAKVICWSFESYVTTGSSLVDMYAKCGWLKEAFKVFDALQSKNLVSWNVMIGGYVQHEHGFTALTVFECMQSNGVHHDELTALYIVKACGDVGALKEGHWIHERIIRAGYESHELLEASLVNMHVKLGSLEEAEKVFNKSSHPSSNICYAMMAGYAQCGYWPCALNLLEEMQQKSLSPDDVTLSFISKACTTLRALRDGMLVHDLMVRCNIDSNVVVGNGLIHMYVQFGNLMAAQKVFEGLREKNVISWNTLITGYVWHGFNFSAAVLFVKLQQQNVLPDNVTFMFMLKACGNMGILKQGNILHGLIVSNKMERDDSLGSSLVDMYAKCGDMESAQNVFDKMPNRDVVSWGAIIAGYALQGCLDVAKQCLQDMLDEGVKPDGRICSSILVACSHAGLVEEGRQYFKAISEVHGLIPSTDHCNGMVDLLCRAGCLLEAKGILGTMPGSPDFFGWMSLFTACRIHGDKELAGICFDQAINMDPNMASVYTTMLNVSADSLVLDNVHEGQELWYC